MFGLVSEPANAMLNLTAFRSGFISTETPGSSGLPLYGVVLIAVTAAAVLALIVMAVVALLCIQHFRKERSKYFVSRIKKIT